MRKAVQNNVINDGHITVLGNTGDYRGLDESYSLKTVIWPWKAFEKSLKFFCLKLYKPQVLVCLWIREDGAS